MPRCWGRKIKRNIIVGSTIIVVIVGGKVIIDVGVQSDINIDTFHDEIMVRTKMRYVMIVQWCELRRAWHSNYKVTVT